MYFSGAAWDGREWRFARADVDEVISITGNLTVNNIDSLREAALLGQGLISLPSFIVSDEFKSGRLLTILTEFRKQFHEANWKGQGFVER